MAHPAPSATRATKPGFARSLSTTRLNLILVDLSNPTHLELNLRLLHDPAFLTNFGDYSLHTLADIRRLWSSTLIKPSTYPALLSRPSPAGYIMCLKPEHSALYTPSPPLADPASGLPTPSGGKMIGLVTLASRSASLPPDMGWALWHEYVNNGFTTEAGRAALKYWRDECGISEMMAWPKETNIPSVRTAARLGFVPNGVVFDRKTGERCACYMLPGMKISFWGGGRGGGGGGGGGGRGGRGEWGI
jgi:RimJ/RimL family protein N-acetyltransferase